MILTVHPRYSQSKFVADEGIIDNSITFGA